MTLVNLYHLGDDIRIGRFFEVLLYRALFCRTDKGIAVFLWKTLRNLALQFDRLDHPGDMTKIDPFDDADAFGREVALLAKT